MHYHRRHWLISIIFFECAPNHNSYSFESGLELELEFQFQFVDYVGQSKLNVYCVYSFSLSYQSRRKRQKMKKKIRNQLNSVQFHVFWAHNPFSTSFLVLKNCFCGLKFYDTLLGFLFSAYDGIEIVNYTDTFYGHFFFCSFYIAIFIPLSVSQNEETLYLGLSTIYWLISLVSFDGNDSNKNRMRVYSMEKLIK